MTETNREKLAAKREKELAEKEFEYEIKRKLKGKFQQLKLEGYLEETENRYIAGALRFFVTLITLYMIYLLGVISFLTFVLVTEMTGADLEWIGNVMGTIDSAFHVSVWIASIYSVYRKKSVLDDLVERFA